MGVSNLAGGAYTRTNEALARLMQTLGLQGVVRGKPVRTTTPNMRAGQEVAQINGLDILRDRSELRHPAGP